MNVPRATSARDALLRRAGQLGPAFLGLVVLEFLLGMSLNLFVSLPTGTPAQILAASPVLDAHVVFGVLLLGISANALRFAAGARSARAALVTGLGLASGILAFGAGLAFAFGSPTATASYAMSVGFVGLLIEAGYLLSLRAEPARQLAVAAPAPGGNA
jgi:hypothetical protein